MGGSLRGRRGIVVAAVLGVALVVGALVARSVPGSEDEPSAPDSGRAGFFAEFGTASFDLVPPEGTRGGATPVARRCALLAETADQRERGLMAARSLDGYDAMIFRFEADTSGGFWMKDTPLPLSIAWFTSAGELVGQADMDPCLGTPSCPTYRPPGPYRLALEVPRGGLAALGVGPGTRLVVGPSC